MTMQRYGLTSDPVDRSRSLQYVVDANGNWTMSCLACHQGQVNGQVIPGVPNTNYALETLTEEVRLVKVQQRSRLVTWIWGRSSYRWAQPTAQPMQ